MTICMGFVGDWRILGFTVPAFFVVMFFRSIATGGGESFYGPSAMALLASHHKETRSVAFSIHQASLYVGLMTSGVLVAWALVVLGSWRNVFIAFGAIGFALGLFFVYALRDGGGGRDAAEAPRKAPLTEGLKAFFLNPSALCATAGFVAIVFVNNAYLFWAPKFMALKFKCDVGVAGAQTMFWHHLFAFAAIIAGGFVTDHFVKRRPRFRLVLQISALLLSVFDVVKPQHRSTVVGCMVMSAFFFGGLSGVAMGKLSDAYGIFGFEIGFATLGVAYLLGAGVMMISFFRTFTHDRIEE